MSRKELRRVEVLAREKPRLEGGGCGEVGGSALPAREVVVEAVSGRRGPRAEASQCGASQHMSQAGEVSAAGAAAGAGKYGAGEEEGFGPTLATEHLASAYGMPMGAETLRRWMLAEGLWSQRRKRKPCEMGLAVAGTS